MAKNSGGLTTVGKILAVISGLLAVIYGVLSLVNQTISALDDAFNLVPSGSSAAGGVLGNIIAIILGILLIFIYIGRIKIEEGLTLGIVVLVIGLVGGGFLAIIGGILIILDVFIN